MNKQKASDIIKAYQDYRHGDDPIKYPIPDLDDLNYALDFAVKELSKPEKKIFKYDDEEKDNILFPELY